MVKPTLLSLKVTWLVSVPLGALFCFGLHGGVLGLVSGFLLGRLLLTILLFKRWRFMHAV
jgi:Na+-driven multidrug efflux pump